MKGDFLGFSFDGIHSSRLGITKVSDGSRYNESLTPDFEDKIISVPGDDGSYFFGTLYRNKPITISIAFDSMTEPQFRQLTKLLSIRRPCRLIFDERPYKVYSAKIATPPQLNYICFDEYKKDVVEPRQGIRIIDRSGPEPIWEQVTPYVPTTEKERIYKGEGTIEFVCVQPYALDQFKTLDEYGDFDFYVNERRYRNNPRTIGEAQERISEEGGDPNDSKYAVVDYGNNFTIYDNIREWGQTSGILPYYQYKDYEIDTVVESNEVAGYNAYIKVYNAGDIDTPFYLYLPYTNNGTTEAGSLSAASGEWIDINMSNNLLRLKPFTSKTTLNNENGVIINTHNHLIEGVLYDDTTSAWRTTGNLYNENIVAGDFPKIRSIDWSMYDTWDKTLAQVIFLNCATASQARIHYNYLYY